MSKMSYLLFRYYTFSLLSVILTTHLSSSLKPQLMKIKLVTWSILMLSEVWHQTLEFNVPFSAQIWIYQRQRLRGGQLSLPSEGRPAIY